MKLYPPSKTKNKPIINTNYVNKYWWTAQIRTQYWNMGIHHNIPYNCRALKTSTLAGAYMLLAEKILYQ